MTVEMDSGARRVSSMLGPGWIVMMADFDAASIIAAAETGATFGTGLVWFFVLLTIPLFFIQYVAGRVGLASGKGLGALIKENFSTKTGYLSAVPMFASDTLTYTAEYFGLALGFTVLGIPLYIGLPAAYLIHISVVSFGKYSTTEKILLAVSTILVVSFLAAGLGRTETFHPEILLSGSSSFLFFLAANAGAVVMPFMLFFQASATGMKGGSLPGVRLDTLLGAVFSEILMIVVEIEFSNSSGGSAISGTIQNLFGSIFSGPFVILFGLGLIAASFLALVVVSLGSTWGVAEVMGIKRKGQLVIYSLESLPGLIIPFLLPNIISLILDLMVVFVFVLLLPGITMGIIAGKKLVMGDQVLKKWEKIGYWTSLACVLALGLMAL